MTTLQLVRHDEAYDVEVLEGDRPEPHVQPERRPAALHTVQLLRLGAQGEEDGFRIVEVELENAGRRELDPDQTALKTRIEADLHDHNWQRAANQLGESLGTSVTGLVTEDLSNAIRLYISRFGSVRLTDRPADKDREAKVNSTVERLLRLLTRIAA